jgi:hypothetical protein
MEREVLSGRAGIADRLPMVAQDSHPRRILQIRKERKTMEREVLRLPMVAQDSHPRRMLQIRKERKTMEREVLRLPMVAQDSHPRRMLD